MTAEPTGSAEPTGRGLKVVGPLLTLDILWGPI